MSYDISTNQKNILVCWYNITPGIVLFSFLKLKNKLKKNLL